MRTRTDGKYGHCETTIEETLDRDDLTADQKRDIAALFSTPPSHVEWSERAEVSPD